MNGTTCNATVGRPSPPRSTLDIRQGWTSSPNGRGTIEIIWNCALTMFLCCWSVLVINVPPPKSNSWQILYRKFVLLALCTIAPEVIFQVALGQWLAAHRSLKLFHSSGYTDWTLRHAFYADMGGFHLQPPNWNSFPIDAKQLHYLVQRGYVKLPNLEETHIRDKDKVDGMLRAITLVQTLWFIVNIIARKAQNLAITALELSTSAFVILSMGTTLCWLHKPADVQSPDFIHTEITIAQILLDGGKAAAAPYNNTPLDFASRQEWIWSIMWAHGLSWLRKFNLAAPPLKRPINRFQNTIVPVIGGSAWALFFVVSMAYFAIFVSAWNFSFPTKIESTLWRAASLTAMLSALVVFIAMQAFSSWYPALRRKLRSAVSQVEDAENNTVDKPAPTTMYGRRKHKTLHAIKSFIKNNSVLKDPALEAPLGLIIITWISGIFYCSARLYIAIADFMELRSLPRSAYLDVDWSAFWPHF